MTHQAGATCPSDVATRVRITGKRVGGGRWQRRPGDRRPDKGMRPDGEGLMRPVEQTGWIDRMVEVDVERDSLVP